MSNSNINSIDQEIDTFLHAFNVTEENQLDRFSYLEFTRSDAAAMLELSTKLATHKSSINDVFSNYMHSVYKNSSSAELIHQQILNFHLIVDGNYDKHYVRKCIAMGIIHRTLERPFDQLIACYCKYKSLIRPVIWHICDNNGDELIRYMDALSKVMYFDIGVALDAYFYGDKFESAQIHRHEQGQHMEQLLVSAEQLLLQKNHDELTGLPNRQYFKNQLTHLLQFAETKSTNTSANKSANTSENKSATIAVIKLGLDHFKKLNDLEGYEIGDHVLKEVGTRLHGYLHKDDLVAYWGGDTFIIALCHIEQTGNIDRICKEINSLISAPFKENNKNIHLACSMGIALYPQDCQNIESLIKYSESSMNLAKEMGGNKIQFFNADLDARLIERTQIANELYSAIESNQFCLHYQPIADLQSGAIISMEALVRWMHPVRGLIPPNQFIAIAEELSIINKLGAWIIRQACQDIRQWREQGASMPRIAINVSPKQFQDPQFTKDLLNTLNELDVNPNSITLEITESLLMQHSEEMEVVIKELKAHGFYLSMDDFGTGYSALQYLKHYPFDYVKIDQSFIKNIMENPGDVAIANAVIAMSHSMGIKVVAEGVETEAQCQYLSQNMCDHIQGYYLSQPMPAQQAVDYIATKFTLPKNLLRMTKASQTLLLVDDEPNILSALKRLFRQDDYKILIANSGAEGLEILKENHVDVIVSDQRMPNMTGVEFLRHAKAKYPDTMRIVLSGYTELQSITDAINEGSIYKFLTKPWDDGQLRNQIREAFTQKEMSDENRKLGLKIQTANQELASANRQLAQILQVKEKQLYRDETSLDIAREALQHIPIPMLGIDEDGMIAFANSATEKLLFQNTEILGVHIDEILPGFNRVSAETQEGKNFSLNIPDFNYLANWRTMGISSKSRGKIITFFEDE